MCGLLAVDSRGRLGDLFSLLPISRPTGIPCYVCGRTDSAMHSNIVVKLNSELRMFRGGLVHRVASCSRVGLALPKGRGYTCFYVASSRSDAFSFLSSLFVAFMFVGLIHCTSACKRSKGLPIPMRVLTSRLTGAKTVLSLGGGVSIVQDQGLDVSYVFRGLPRVRGQCPLGR